MAGAVRHHACLALSFLGCARVPRARLRVAARERERDSAPLMPGARRNVIDGATSTSVHEAYLAVLAFGQLLRGAAEDGLADVVAIETCRETVNGMLDALSPFIDLADNGLRRALLDDVPLEDVPIEDLAFDRRDRAARSR